MADLVHLVNQDQRVFCLHLLETLNHLRGREGGREGRIKKEKGGGRVQGREGGGGEREGEKGEGGSSPSLAWPQHKSSCDL